MVTFRLRVITKCLKMFFNDTFYLITFFFWWFSMGCKIIFQNPINIFLSASKIKSLVLKIPKINFFIILLTSKWMQTFYFITNKSIKHKSQYIAIKKVILNHKKCCIWIMSEFFFFFEIFWFLHQIYNIYFKRNSNEI